MARLVNRAQVSTSTTGTGTITLGAALPGFRTFANAGVADGDEVRYVIEDGANWEIGVGTYSSTGPTMARLVEESSNSNTAINLSGAARVYVAATAEDFDGRVGFEWELHEARNPTTTFADFTNLDPTSEWRISFFTLRASVATATNALFVFFSGDNLATTYSTGGLRISPQQDYSVATGSIGFGELSVSPARVGDTPMIRSFIGTSASGYTLNQFASDYTSGGPILPSRSWNAIRFVFDFGAFASPTLIELYRRRNRLFGGS